MNWLRHEAGQSLLFGEVKPAGDIGRLMAALRSRAVSIAGMLLTEESVTDWPAELRAAMGSLLQRCRVIYAADEQTLEWAPHYACNAKLGEHPLWLMRPSEELAEELRDGRVLEAACYDEAIELALVEAPFVLRIYPRDRQADSRAGRPDTYHLLHRFAARYGVSSDRIVYGAAMAPEGLQGPTVQPGRVQRAISEARQMLDTLRREPARAPLEALEAMLSGEASKTPSGRRRLEPGTVFDPATHYQADYYDGTGIEYMQPDETWAVYHGTGLRWGGNEHVARFIAEIGHEKGRRLLDYGCSSGDFLGHMLSEGWAVRGYDISQAAIDRAEPGVREALSTELPGVTVTERFDHVTAWDLLEHIWAKDLPEVFATLRCMLRIGGLLWANICTRGEMEKDYELQPGVTFSAENSWLLCSGHVTIHRWWWWRKQLREAGFKPRDDLAQQWQVRRAEHPTFAQGSASWSPRNFIVMEKA